jgi:toxin-antitoxin system PIN domain toxin
MRALLDVNVLIALLDQDHISHRHAMTWFGQHAGAGWASTPITENGCVRILSHPAYANAQPLPQVIRRLRLATTDPVHEFWEDSLSMTDQRWFDATRIHGPRQLTDVYLLALAVQHDGRLVTFDSGIALDAVNGAESRHLLVL